MNRNVEALTEYRIYQTKDPSNLSVYEAMANLHMLTGNPDQAIRDIDAALALGTLDPVAISKMNIEKGLLSSDSRFMKYWRVWLRACVLFYMLLLGLEALGREGFGQKLGEWPSKIIYGFVYAGSTCFSSLAFLTLFRKFVTRVSPLWDSLTRNAYCIYLVHYIFVLWCQYALLNVDLPAFIKFLITFLISMLISWQVSILLRKIPVVKKYV